MHGARRAEELLVVGRLVPNGLGGHALRHALHERQRLVGGLHVEEPRVAREDAHRRVRAQPVELWVRRRVVCHSVGRGVVPAVGHALHVRVPVQEGEGVRHVDDVHVGEEHVAPDGDELLEDAELEPRRGVVVRAAPAGGDLPQVGVHPALLAEIVRLLVQRNKHKLGHLRGFQAIDEGAEHLVDVLVGHRGENLGPRGGGRGAERAAERLEALAVHRPARTGGGGDLVERLRVRASRREGPAGAPGARAQVAPRGEVPALHGLVRQGPLQVPKRLGLGPRRAPPSRGQRRALSNRGSHVAHVLALGPGAGFRRGEHVGEHRGGARSEGAALTYRGPRGQEAAVVQHAVARAHAVHVVGRRKNNLLVEDPALRPGPGPRPGPGEAQLGALGVQAGADHPRHRGAVVGANQERRGGRQGHDPH
mmetsp:Transcript_18863/g.63218  ORF Transcript_18863/g.63218 Transcript_18863/m.63218 type:complete len:422 (+) Transcript_18863:799-2064(+)